MTWTILNADARQIPLADKSVQCVVTSPPYWGLRDYGTARWEGGDDGCDHVERIMKPSAKSTLEDHGENGRSPYLDSLNGIPYRDLCRKCGATRIDSQIGLEKTPQEYVDKIVAVFREVWRVLRDDGVCFINLGDSYAGSQQSGGMNGLNGIANGPKHVEKHQGKLRDIPANLKPKDLVGIPWRCAFALQADGWYLRSDIIWAKPNPMPESVTDRPTKAHEYIFLLSKSERYFWDQDAVREPHVRLWDETNGGSISTGRMVSAGGAMGDMSSHPKGYPLPNDAGRNIRTVWQIATQPYAEAHFATFPEELAERCIKAGTSEKGCCAKCGKARERVTERGETMWEERKAEGEPMRAGEFSRSSVNSKLSGKRHNEWKANHPDQFLGWQPGCACDAPTVPCVVLDPFAGAGTVCLVADKLGRRGIGLELKQDYCRMARNRCYDDAPLLAGL